MFRPTPGACPSFLIIGLLAAGCGHQNHHVAGAPAELPTAPPLATVATDDPLPACLRTVPVAGSPALAAAITDARPGDCVVLGDGEYTFPVITRTATAASPIVIRAQNRLKAVVSAGNIEIRGSAHVMLEGLAFTSSGGIEVRDSEHCRLSRCRIQPAEVKDQDWVTIAGKSHHIRIDRNDFGPKRVVSNMVMVSGEGVQVAQHNRIDRNYFHDITYGGGNGWEAIRLGSSTLAPSKGFNVVELNLFKGASGDPETISVKSSDAIVRYNTYRATNGEITLRHGNRTQVYGNHMLADGLPSARGIRVLGADHKIFNNYFEDIQGGSAILLRGGSHADTDTNGREFYRVYRAQVLNNTIVRGGAITVGGRGRLAPLACVVANNRFQSGSGAIEDKGEGTRVEKNLVLKHAPQGLTASNPAGNEPSSGVVTSRPLTEADVGPDAP